MSTLVKEALVSTKADVIKEARKNEKGRVTRKVDRILTILKVESGSYDHNSISKIELGQAEVSLKEAFKNVEDLHDRFQCYRAKGADAAKESEIEIEQNDYIVAVEKKYNEGLKSIEKYNIACEMAQKEVLLKEAKESFERAKNVVIITLEAEEVEKQRAAPIVKEEFVKNFENLLATNESLVKSLEKINPINARENEKANLTKERMAVSELNNKLDVLILENQSKETQSVINNSTSQILNSTMNQSKSHGVNFLKLQKISPPKFSGSYRDFPKFKRDFNTIFAI